MPPRREHHQHHRHPFSDGRRALLRASSSSSPLGVSDRMASIISIIASRFWDGKQLGKQTSGCLLSGPPAIPKTGSDDADDARRPARFEPVSAIIRIPNRHETLNLSPESPRLKTLNPTKPPSTMPNPTLAIIKKRAR